MSEPSQARMYIIGAGVSGLVAALELEKAGHRPVMLEKSDQVGGRLRTDHWKGLPMDHGFQVLLTAYPAARRYLDLDGLRLKKFLPGALVFQNGKPNALGDPLRSSAFLLPTLAFPYASLRDKYLIWQLARRLRKKSLEAIFGQSESTTLQHLRHIGFSESIIDAFFRPFFAGIFLEPDLYTSSRMFEFVYKMFSEGYAALPSGGIADIPRQLKDGLKQTEIRFGQSVAGIDGAELIMEDGTRLPFDKLIIATDPAGLLKGVQPTQWKSCDNLYFSTSHRSFGRPIIGLVGDRNALINNLHFVTDLYLSDQTNEQLLSVTVVREHELSEDSLVHQVQQELTTHCGIAECNFVARYRIPRALPRLDALRYAPDPASVVAGDHIFHAGDHLANGSLNAAMESGRVAAGALTNDFS